MPGRDWRESIVSAYIVENRGDIMQAIDNLGGRHFLYEMVLSEPWKTDNEFEK